MGDIQRIFYYHVPSNIIAEIFPYINFVASGVYLYYRQRNPGRALAADALALVSAELTVVFCSIGLASGMLWARPVWGIWWTWDARLTSFFLLWLLYVSYLLLRKLSFDGADADVGGNSLRSLRRWMCRSFSCRSGGGGRSIRRRCLAAMGIWIRRFIQRLSGVRWAGACGRRSSAWCGTSWSGEGS